ncbi:MAG: DUF4362 domain-containing protein, partial [Bacillota bacterium]|nr:DUF4362 domain-containing protein [Bacillota bacterium]
AIILALIDNAGSVEYVFDKETYSYKRSDVEKKYNIVLSKQSKDFKTFEKFYKKVFNDYKMGKILRILAGTNVENPADNVVVISDEKLKQKGNIEVFEKDAGKGQVSALSVIRYTAEGDPIVTAVYYDGKRFYLLEDDSRDKFRGNGEAYTQHKFEYLKIFEENGYRHYYLVNDKNVTYDELFKGMLSSRYGDYIPNYPLASYEI